MTYLKKIMSKEEAAKLRKKLKDDGLRLIFTNGCFDLLHPGHLRYLEEARSLGDFLLIGLNSDDSIKAIKGEKTIGPPRPVCPENVRAEMLAGLASVDAVVVFNEETPLELIKIILPDVLVKGGDWALDQIVGSDIVLNRGGEVKSLILAEGYSTSALIEYIASHCIKQ